MQNNPSKQGEKETDKEPADNNRADDQKEHGYYYDDAHGYEQFDPELDEGADDESETKDD